MTYCSEDFLLHSGAARTLYHDYAESMPILDYHSHLSPRTIAQDDGFDTITDLWLSQDHYKWRCMRANGIDEYYITGKASDKDKFCAWADTVSRAQLNPMYDWTHLELKRYFGISDKLLSPATAPDIFASCNEKCSDPSFSARNLLRKMNVRVVCTTDDPADDLRFHAQLRKENFEIQMLPTFRPEKVLAIGDPVCFNGYIEKLSQASGIGIITFDDLVEALDKRHAFFHDLGCRSADLALETIPVEQSSAEELNAIFSCVRSGKAVNEGQRARYQAALLLELGRMNHRRGWVQQLHLGAMRNVRSRLFSRIGADAGGDCMGDGSIGRPLARYLDALDRDNQLTKTILYNINPRDDELLACIAGAFQDGSVPGKIQCGPAWWFMDHKDGIIRHLNALAGMGLVGRFIGMTTDSRSLVSFVRHEYFRRILCDWVGTAMENHDIPGDPALTGAMIRDMCFNNAQDFFRFGIAYGQTTKEKHECELVR
jgi:glucuronate isomerase